MSRPNTKPHQRLEWGKLYGSSPGLMLSLAAQTAPLIVITPDSHTAQRLVADIQFYADPQLPILTFPDWETLPYDLFSPHQDIISERLTTLYRITEFEVGMLVLPVNTLMARLAPTDYVSTNSLLITTGQQLDFEKLRQQLEAKGYRGVDQVLEHGEFAVRGGLLDLFPMGNDVPYRIDLFGDEVDSIRPFDPETQRSKDSIQEIRLLPAREFPLTTDSIKQFRSQWCTEFSDAPNNCPVYRDVGTGLVPAGIEYYLPLFFEQTHTLFDYLPSNSVIVTFQNVADAAEQFWQEVEHRYEQLRYNKERPLLSPTRLFLPVDQIFGALKNYSHINLSQEPTKGINFATQPPPDLIVESRSSKPLATLKKFLETFKGRVLIAAETTGRRESLLELLGKYDLVPHIVENWRAFLRHDANLCLTVAPLEYGLLIEVADDDTNPFKYRNEITSPVQQNLLFNDPELSYFVPEDFAEITSLAIISELQLFGERVAQRRLRKKFVQRDADAIVRDLTELTVGAPVVHEEHGVGRYQGLITLTVGEVEAEFLDIEYAKQDKLYVPVTSLHLINRFTGMDPEHAPLHQLGSNKWDKAKRKATKKATDMAAELLDIYARRAARKGHAFKIDHSEYAAFSQAFPFEETADQIDAITAVVNDMYSEQPMDRLICGDVGFGKTEVAMRAAFIAVLDGKQVAILVPTTLLTQQHQQTFQDRFADWPVRVENLSRFRTQKQQTTTLQALAEGKVDIVIGTHKLLQKSVSFKELGLIIIDEEHRFGVRQKERLKSLRAEVDILTLTATPIPRSLNMALANLRDLSVIATAPAGRLAVQTFVKEWQDSLIAEAILRELKRGGQVYFLHNEVDTIIRTAQILQDLLPEALVEIAHGQMRGRELEQVMKNFYHRRFNVLVCTTIIESGIDIPTANTIIINRADKLGLAQLYQLRGRVGRSHHRAYAYLLVPPRKSMSNDARKRIDALDALDEVGMGFHLASNDLEIRGAGELLGDEQSGHIQEVGYGLYTDLLERAVADLQSGKQPELERPLTLATEVNLHSSALLPSDYLPDVHIRLIIYKRIANAANEQALDDIQMEMIDRFGLLPEPAKTLIKIAELRLEAIQLGIQKVDFGPQGGYLLFGDNPNVKPQKIVKLMQNQPLAYKMDGQQKLFMLLELPTFKERWQALEELFTMIS